MSLTELRTATSDTLASSAEQSCPALFAVDVDTTERETVLTLHGELDLWTAPLFVSALDAIDERVPCVVLDLSDLTFIDAGAIGNIYRARDLARQRGGDLVLRSANPCLSRVLELTGLAPGGSDGAFVAPMPLPLPSHAHERATIEA